MENKILFSEKQKFNQWWIWPFFVLTTGLFLYGCVQQLIYKIPFGDNSMSDSGLLFSTVAISSVSALFFVFRLETNITEEAIYVRFFPLHLKYRKYLWTDIETAEVRTYKPILEYGGYGIRGFGNNRAFNIAGKQGLQLVFKDRRKLLIGTQKANQLIEMLNSQPLKK